MKHATGLNPQLDNSTTRQLATQKPATRLMKITNVEIKAHCKDPAGAERMLLDLKAKFAGTDEQTDTYFKVKEGRLKLREGNIENSLIYYQRANEAASKRSDVLLYKTQDAAELKPILKQTLEILVIVKKRRKIFFIDQVKFHIDEVDGLGAFLEIEVIDEAGNQDEADLRKQCLHYQRLLSVNDSDLVRVSYSDMILHKKTPEIIVDSTELIKTKLIALTAPSGAGKTTIARHLLKTFDDLAFSISATTRERRPHEEDGRDYYFLSKEEFEQKIANDEFVEWEEVYAGQYYGTLKSEIERIRKAGKHVIFDIDVQGATSIKKVYGDEAMVVFIKPPSPEVLFERLRNRKTESVKSLEKRIARARRELTYEDKFDRVLVNDILEVAFQDGEALIKEFTKI